MAQIIPYLQFGGKCREAMTFYKECLGGELMLQTVEGTPMAEGTPPEGLQEILHSSLTNGNLKLMASDMMGSDSVAGNTISLSLDCGSEEELNRHFTALSAGGEITHPLTPEFWGAIFGMLTDKYGFKWLLNYDKPKS